MMRGNDMKKIDIMITVISFIKVIQLYIIL